MLFNYNKLSFGLWVLFLGVLMPNAVLAGDDNVPQIQIYTADYPPYSYRDTNGDVIGISTDKVRAFMAEAGLSYKIVIVPWSRALLLIEQDPYALIYSLDRTAEREDLYLWLFALNNVESHLLGRRNLFNGDFSKTLAISGAYTAACSQASSSCELLKQYGFKSENIMSIAARSPNDLLNLLLRNRADFILEDPNAIFGNRSRLDAIRTLDVVEHGVTDYLAAGKNLSPLIVSAIQKRTK